jgi:hypothetical protein
MTTTIEVAPSLMTATLPHEAIINGERCRDCRTPRGLWNRLHWLYREWSGKCPDCHASDIRLDFRDKNQED